MLKKFFKKEKKNLKNKNILVAALLIHAAKIDENYTDDEKKIITSAIMQLENINFDQAQKLLKIVSSSFKIMHIYELQYITYRKEQFHNRNKS